MADQIPLVLINGTIQQLPTGDVLEEELIWMREPSQIDFVGDTIIYKGWAEPSTLTSTASWRISKTEFVGVDEDIIITWADGDILFNNIWDNRAGLTYV